MYRVLQQSIFLISILCTAFSASFANAQAPAPDAGFDNAFDAAFDDAFDDDWEDDEPSWPWNGFAEAAVGRRLDDGTAILNRQTLGDVRLRVETDWSSDSILINFTGDVVFDDVVDDFESDIRDLNLQISPGGAVDLKIGRQILTWGTGDLLFLNDLFPKSWVSFFAGREDEYLKGASDAFRLTWYGSAVNLDFAWSPTFEPDEYLNGERFEFFSPVANSIIAPIPPFAATAPLRNDSNGELALRLFRTVGSSEYAVYAYRGFFKQPLGLDGALAPVFPKLDVIGASLRRPLASGLFNAEFAYHDSRDDSSGANPFVPNSQFRWLFGYEFEARPRLTVGLQYYLEQTTDYAALLSNSATPSIEPERNRHVLTTRLTYRTSRDRLTYSLFAFVSPSDNDYFLRPTINYRYSDQWNISGGANLLGGNRPHTFFGQLEQNTNAYLRVRYSY